MADARPKSTFSPLLQAFFVERLIQQRAVSPQTIASYRDTFRLFLEFVQHHIGKEPTDVALTDINAPLVLAFLSHLEVDRHNSVAYTECTIGRTQVILEVRCTQGYIRHSRHSKHIGNPDEAL